MMEIILIILGTIIVIEFLAKFERAYKETERPANHENR
jgi:hypothetical protein